MSAPAVEMDPKRKQEIAELESMGFPSTSSRIALLLHSTLERATTFLLQANQLERDKMIAGYEQLELMGFDPVLIKLGLEKWHGDAERAMEWILQAEEREKRQTLAATSSASATPTVPAPLVTAQFSDEQVRSDLLVHRAVFANDTAALGEYCKRGLVNEYYRGRTPLLLAYALGRYELVSFLLNRGADPRLKSPRGWSLLQQACMQRQSAIALDIHLHALLMKQSEWESKQKALLQALERMADFTLEINWEVKSWIPMVGRFAPKDNFTIWKRGNALRLDSNVRAVRGMNIEKGLMSYLFMKGSVWLVDHTYKVYSDALSEFRNPNFEDIQAQVHWLMQSDNASRSEINSDDVTFHEKKTLLRGTKYEKVGDYKCRVIGMEGLKFIEIKSKKTPPTTAASPDENKDEDDSPPASPLPSSSSSSNPLRFIDTTLDASTYFDAAEVAAYNQQRRKKERHQKRRAKRMAEAMGELQVAASSSSAASATVANPSSGGSSSRVAAAVPTSSSASVISSAIGADDEDDEEDGDDEDEDDGPTSSSTTAGPTASSTTSSTQTPTASDDGMVIKTSSVDATLCLTPDFPLPLSHLLILLDLLSPASSNLAKLRDILAVQLPTDPTSGRSSFPVRITFPIVTQVHACVTFNNFELRPPAGPTAIGEDVFVIPKEFKERRI